MDGPERGSGFVEEVPEEFRVGAVMRYKGYRAAVTYDEESGVLQGEVQGTRDVIMFEATSVEQLGNEFRISVDDYLAVCAERGRSPDRPYSGKVPLRIFPEVHREAAFAAMEQGKSLNSWVAEVVENAAYGYGESRKRAPD